MPQTWILAGLPQNYEATRALSRLRPGEAAAGIGGALLLGASGRLKMPVLGSLLRITGTSGLALTYFQATRRAPALPVVLSVVVTALGGASAIGLLARVLIASRGRAGRPRALNLGLMAAWTVAAGGFASMRQESGTELAQLGELQTITLDS